MSHYTVRERSLHWPVSAECMARYEDGSQTEKYPDGNAYWYRGNRHHRDGDKPAVIFADGRLIWAQNGRRHRDGDKPAYIGVDGTLYWYQNGQRHRSCGPAVIDARVTLEWWINNKNITYEVKEWLDGQEWHGAPEQIFEFQLRFL